MFSFLNSTNNFYSRALSKSLVRGLLQFIRPQPCRSRTGTVGERLTTGARGPAAQLYRGELPFFGRDAELRALKERGIWAHAASGGIGTDPYRSLAIP